MNRLSIDIQNLSFSYPNCPQSLSNISLQIKQGESVALVGANGAGKSTLLLLLTGLLIADSGSIQINEQGLSPDTFRSIRKEVGMVFQHVDNQLFLPTVRDDVAFGPLNQELDKNEIDKRVYEALDAVNALHLIDKMTHELSGGEKRSVAIAGVLASKPNILLLDEPSSDLDPAARRNLINVLTHSHHTKIIATHDLDLAMELCSRIVILNEGHIIADGEKDTIFGNIPLLKQARLEQPLSFIIKQLKAD